MLTASRQALMNALSFSSSVVERRNTIPILANVLFTRGQQGLCLRMTDLDVELQIDVAADLAMDFRPFTVPAQLLYEIVRKLPDGAECSLEADGPQLHNIRLKSGRSKFSLQVLPEVDFPASLADGGTASFVVGAKAFADALAAVSFAISTEETRYYLNGVYIHPEADGINLVATDGHRLAKRYIALKDGAPEMPGVIVPRKTIGVIAKLLGKDGDIQINVSDSRASITMEGKRLSSKLIDGTFPDYRRVIPQDRTVSAEIDGPTLKAAVDRVSTVSSERGKAMRFSFRHTKLTLTVNNPAAGTSEEQIDFHGECAVETGFNARYVLDAIAHLPDGSILFSSTDAGSPAVLRADGDHAENLVVLMPMRV